MRTVVASASAALQAQSLMIIWLVRLDLADSIFLSTSLSDVVWDGKTWLGAGMVGSIDAVDDSSGVNRPGF